jgi:hypothetical protein
MGAANTRIFGPNRGNMLTGRNAELDKCRLTKGAWCAHDAERQAIQKESFTIEHLKSGEENSESRPPPWLSQSSHGGERSRARAKARDDDDLDAEDVGSEDEKERFDITCRHWPHEGRTPLNQREFVAVNHDNMQMGHAAELDKRQLIKGAWRAL